MNQYIKDIIAGLTPEEVQEYRDMNYACEHPSAWVWSEEDLSWMPPFPHPQDGQPYLWNNENQAWDPFPGFPLADAPQGE